jgi:hypothetical protein
MHVNARRLAERLEVSRSNRCTVGPTERDHRKLAHRRCGGKRDAHQSGAQPPGAALALL